MKTKTKSTVARRRVKRRQDRVSHKKLRTLRSRKYARKTARKVMRGGGDGACTAYVLYDKIPFFSRTKDEKGGPVTKITTINVPICVILIEPNKPKDEIYLFFNAQMTPEDIIKTVKLLLGIPNETSFEVIPPIQVQPASEPQICNSDKISDKMEHKLHIGQGGAVYACIEKWRDAMDWRGTIRSRLQIPAERLLRSLGSTFVKLSGIMSYDIYSGTFNSNTQLDKVKPTSHKITTTDTGYKSLNGQKIKQFLLDKNNGFMKKVLDSGGVLENLYKEYFTSITENEVDAAEIKTKFGKDLEGDDIKDREGNVVKPWSSKAESYAEFKINMNKNIKDNLDDMKNHRTFGLDAKTVQTLETRPLEITNPIIINSIKDNTFNSIDSTIDSEAFGMKIIFTNLSKKWWTEEEEDALRITVNQVEREKKKRIDYCYGNESARSCSQTND